MSVHYLSASRPRPAPRRRWRWSLATTVVLGVLVAGAIYAGGMLWLIVHGLRYFGLLP